MHIKLTSASYLNRRGRKLQLKRLGLFIYKLNNYNDRREEFA